MSKGRGVTDGLALPLHHLILIVACAFSGMADASWNNQSTATANISSQWATNEISKRGVNFSDGSLVLPILHTKAFGCGFYCKGKPTFSNCFFTVFILMCYDYDLSRTPDQGCYPQVVWSANRNRPVKFSATLTLNRLGDLELTDADGTTAWSTNSSRKSVVGMNLTESGNLVLFDQNSAVVWQSFDHPTDTLLMGQQLRVGQNLTSSNSSTNLSEFVLINVTLRAGGLLAIVNTHPPQLYYQTEDPISIDNSTNLALRDGYFGLFSTSPPENIHVQFVNLSSDGHMRAYGWGNGQWQEIADLFTGKIGDCGYPLVCGEYGICSNGQCNCPKSTNRDAVPYFKEKKDRRPDLGCPRVMPLSCEGEASHHHGFVELKNVTYFDSTKELINISAEDCKRSCSSDCLCKAAFFYFPVTTDQYPYCSLKFDVFSLMDNDVERTQYYSIAYIKVQNKPPKGKLLPVVLGSSLGSLALVVGVLVLLIWKRRQASEADEDYLNQLSGMPTRFSYDELRYVTRDFSKKLGEGGFASVFEGTLDDGTKVAVKRLKSLVQIKNSFIAEVETIGKIHHVNLVRLLGFCTEKSHKLLVYEHMSNGSLDRWIFHKKKIFGIKWQRKKNIILNIAKGLNYLHVDCWQKIIHLDIKPQNILLDDNFNAKVSDFGLSKLIDRDQSQVVTTMRGTPGYLAPEWLSAAITEKVDVYSFGVVILEIVCGRKLFDISQDEEDRHLLNLLKRMVEEGRLLDMVENHGDDMRSYGLEAVKMIKLAAWCLQADYTRRPSMSIVTKVLDGVMDVEDVDLDYNFWSHPAKVGLRENLNAETVPLLPSILSGPR
ncbi:G-type lectin S-receptor-like serine/threonine-protein kinase SD2-5 [Punica granatum]|uniref:Receptor-like serine/threonine-protein kinase n=2 Tax=Punica granatum TaxID=22663 RepID=A0A2I0IJU8_PUNGR|nr:G-type lectin S-receptor-like serine/threonine-protein kinase SD2-5 [Punica granatum]PKI44023.1 hypothetical protein CRG98_035608 [Punica granatum]